MAMTVVVSYDRTRSEAVSDLGLTGNEALAVVGWIAAQRPVVLSGRPAAPRKPSTQTLPVKPACASLKAKRIMASGLRLWQRGMGGSRWWPPQRLPA